MSDNNIAKWNLDKVVELYNEKIQDNIFERAYRIVFTENAQDDDIKNLLSRSTRMEPWILRCGGVWWMPTRDKSIYIRLQNHPTPYANYPILDIRDELIYDLIKEMCQLHYNLYYKIIIKPLIDVCTYEQIFELYHGYTYEYTKYRFDPNIALSRDIELRSRNGHIVTIHAHVAVSIGEYLKTVVLDKNFKPRKFITIPCEDTTLEWFVSSAYTGVFEFNAKIDKIDAINTLDFLLIVKKETLIEKCVTHIVANTY